VGEFTTGAHVLESILDGRKKEKRRAELNVQLLPDVGSIGRTSDASSTNAVQHVGELTSAVLPQRVTLPLPRSDHHPQGVLYTIMCCIVCMVCVRCTVLGRRCLMYAWRLKKILLTYMSSHGSDADVHVVSYICLDPIPYRQRELQFFRAGR
jgi:hypothetical protein